MKSEDPLLVAWEEMLARKRDAPAIFNTAGEILRTFRGIGEHAQGLETTMASALEAKGGSPKPHNVSAIQIGNHQDWPSLLLVSLRKRNGFLPIDESVAQDQADNAVSVSAMHGST